jgi:hypothetical protein
LVDSAGLARLLPWPKAATNGAKARHDALEKKSIPQIDFVRDVAAGRAAYLHVAIRYRAENVAEPPLPVFEDRRRRGDHRS